MSRYIIFFSVAGLPGVEANGSIISMVGVREL